MESPKPYGHGPPNPLLSVSSFLHQQCHRLGSQLSSRLADTMRLAGSLAANLSPPAPGWRHTPIAASPPFASVAQAKASPPSTVGSGRVAKALAGTAVYTVSNSNNEFVLISDPDGAKSIGLLCFRQEDAESFLAQVSYICSLSLAFLPVGRKFKQGIWEMRKFGLCFFHVSAIAGWRGSILVYYIS